MKIESVPINWLNEINGRTVAHAIAYLSTLPPDHELSYWQSNGDDQGVEISSELTYQRPYTEQELAELAAMRKTKQIQDIERSIAYYEKQAAYRERAGKAKKIEGIERSIAYCEEQAAYWERAGKAHAATSYQRDAERFRQQLKELT